MHKKFYNILYLGLYLLVATFAEATATDYDSSKYLSRYFLDDEDQLVESCRYYYMDSTISFKGDAVFSPSYENIKSEMKKQIEFLQKPSQPSDYKVTFMSVILSATGKNEHGEIERVFNKLYVREEKDGTPTLLTFQEEDSKILVFSSNDSPRYKLKAFKKQWIFFNKESEYGLFNLSSFADVGNHPIKTKFDELYNNSSHAEPLWLAALLTLSSSTFKELLSEGYGLTYYEIHFLSNYDACSNCSALLYNKGIPELRQRFGANLFLFYHSWYPIINSFNSPYRVKFKSSKNAEDWDIVSASFNFEDYDLKVKDEEKNKGDESSCKKLFKQKTSRINIRGSTNLKTIPSYYVGVIHQYEGKTINIIQ